MVAGIAQSRCEYFRVHDSGDMFSLAYAQCWHAVCVAMPEIRFWIATRSWQQPKSPLPVLDPLLNTLRQLATLPNVTVRSSALDFGDAAPVIAGLHAGSGNTWNSTDSTYE
jgi:Gene product 88